MKRKKFKKIRISRSRLYRLSFELVVGQELIVKNFWGKKIFHLTALVAPEPAPLGPGFFDRVNINGKSFTIKYSDGLSFEFRHMGLVLVSGLYAEVADKRYSVLLNNGMGLNMEFPRNLRIKTDGYVRRN